MIQAHEHSVTHAYQPTSTSCGQAALSILLSHYGVQTTAEKIMQQMPTHKRDNGEDWGTITQQLATWTMSQGFVAEMYSFDFQIIDLSWAKFPKDQLIKRLEAAKRVRDVPALAREWSEQYAQAYIDFIDAGGTLHIQPHVTSKLLYKLLVTGPVFACVCYNVLYNSGRAKSTGVLESVPDDLTGDLSNHFIVVYGNTRQGDFLIADPYRKPGLHTIEPEQLLCAMTAAQMECDNLWFTLEKTS